MNVFKMVIRPDSVVAKRVMMTVIDILDYCI